jgi:hypothetical protein
MEEKKRPVVQMLEQLERQWYIVSPVLGGTNPDVQEVIIQCRHCEYSSRHNDKDHDQSSAAALIFLGHLKSKHADILKREHEISVGLL